MQRSTITLNFYHYFHCQSSWYTTIVLLPWTPDNNNDYLANASYWRRVKKIRKKKTSLAGNWTPVARVLGLTSGNTNHYTTKDRTLKVLLLWRNLKPNFCYKCKLSTRLLLHLRGYTSFTLLSTNMSTCLLVFPNVKTDLH